MENNNGQPIAKINGFEIKQVNEQVIVTPGLTSFRGVRNHSDTWTELSRYEATKRFDQIVRRIKIENLKASA